VIGPEPCNSNSNSDMHCIAQQDMTGFGSQGVLFAAGSNHCAGRMAATLVAQYYCQGEPGAASAVSIGTYLYI